MKKNLFFIALIFAGITLNAQFTASVHEEPIESEYTASFNTIDSSAKLEYVFHNNTSSTIALRSEIVEIEGADGTNFEICFGECVPNVSEGMIIPGNSAVAITSGGSTNAFNHLWNKNDSSPLIEYRVKFFQINSLGNPTGEEFFINYVYNENLGVYDIEQTDSVKILNTLVRDNININAEENANINIYAIDGKLVKTSSLKSGINILSLNELKAGVYIVKIATESGKNYTEKVAIK